MCCYLYNFLFNKKYKLHISEDVIQKTRELLSYDINFQNIWTSIDTLIQENRDQIENQLENQIETNTIQENKLEKNNEKIENDTTEKSENQTVSKETKKEDEENTKIGGIGGSKKEETKEATESNNKTSSKKTQMEIDAEYIKENYKFELPIKGTVTSRYGKREATEIISENHQGIDIGADTGTAIYAAIDGEVTLVAFDETDYRKACRDQ